MKKIKFLVVASGVLIVLILLTSIIRWLVDRNDENDMSAVTTEYVLSLDWNQADQIRFEKSDGNAFNFLLNDDAVFGDYWQLVSDDADLSQLDFSQNAIQTTIDLLMKIHSDRMIDDVTNFAQFGLEQPQTIVLFYSQDILISKISMGNLSADGLYTYVRIDDRDQVILISSDYFYQLSKSDINYLDKSLIQMSYSQIEHFSFYRRSDDFSADIYSTSHLNNASHNSDWTITEPIEWSAGQRITDIVTQISFLEVTQFFRFEELQNLNVRLDEPIYSFCFYDNLGINECIDFHYISEDLIYGYSEMNDLYFTIDREYLSGLESPVVSFLYNRLTPFSIHQVSSIECQFPEGSFFMEMDVEEQYDLSSAFALVYVDGRNAKVLDSSGQYYFDILFRSIVGMPFASFDYDMIQTQERIELMEPAISFTIKTTDRRTIEYSFYDEGSMDLYLCIDGRYTGLMVNRDNFYYFDPDHLHNIGVWDAYILITDALDAQLGGIYDVS